MKDDAQGKGGEKGKRMFCWGRLFIEGGVILQIIWQVENF